MPFCTFTSRTLRSPLYFHFCWTKSADKNITKLVELAPAKSIDTLLPPPPPPQKKENPTAVESTIDHHEDQQWLAISRILMIRVRLKGNNFE